MLLSPARRRGLLVALLSGVWAGVAAAEDSIEFQTTVYAQTDSPETFGATKGEPITDVDEEATVIEPIVIVKYDLEPRTQISLQIDADIISSASIERLSRPPVSGQGGATGDVRVGGKLGISHQYEFANVRGSVGYSNEYEYRSIQLSFGFSKEMFERQSTLSADVSVYIDEVDVIDRLGNEPGGEARNSVNLDLGWSEILSPNSELDLRLSLSYMDGFLQTAYNRVYLDGPAGVGVEVDEVHPDSRMRAAIGATYRYYFDTGTSIHVGERLYADDWGVTSSATRLELYQFLVADFFFIGLKYRYYFQTEADFVVERGRLFNAQQINAVATPGAYNGFERTQDADLRAFSSHTIGVAFAFVNIDMGPGRTGSLSLSFDYMTREDGLDAYWTVFNFKVGF